MMRLVVPTLALLAALSAGCKNEFELFLTRPFGTGELPPPERVAAMPYLHDAWFGATTLGTSGVMVAFTPVPGASDYRVYWRPAGGQQGYQWLVSLGPNDCQGGLDSVWQTEPLCIIGDDFADPDRAIDLPTPFPIEIAVSALDATGESDLSFPLFVVPIREGRGGLEPSSNAEAIQLIGPSASYGGEIAHGGDVNADGRPDLVVGIPQSLTLELHLGTTDPVTGMGGFTPVDSLQLSNGAGGDVVFVRHEANLRPGIAVAEPDGGLGMGMVHFLDIPDPVNPALNQHSAILSNMGGASAGFGSSMTSVTLGGGKGEILVVGAPGFDSGNSEGAVLGYEYLPGPGTWSTTANFSIPGPASGSEFGAAVHAAELAGDGAEDLIVGAPGERTVFVYCDETTLPQAQLPYGSGPNPLGFGPQTAIATGDVNGDGWTDIVVGDGNALPGVFWFPGVGPCQFDHERALNAPVVGQGALDNYGASVAVGDVNGDGLDDIWASGGDTNTPGAVCFYFGSRDGIAPDPTACYLSQTNSFGAELVSGSDVDGGGLEELADRASDEVFIGTPFPGVTPGFIQVIRGAPARGPGILAGPRMVHQTDDLVIVEATTFEADPPMGRAYDCWIDWGERDDNGQPIAPPTQVDGCDPGLLGSITHTYPEPGAYGLRINAGRLSEDQQFKMLSGTVTTVCVGNPLNSKCD